MNTVRSAKCDVRWMAALLMSFVTSAVGTVQAAGITDATQVFEPAALSPQPVGQPFTDPAFGTVLRRVSDTSANGRFESQIYNQLQAFSSDNAYLLLDSSAGFLVRKVADFSQVAGLDPWSWNAPRWHPAKPHVIVHFDSNADTTLRVQFTDVDTLETTTAYTFPDEYRYIRVSESFDELSRDGRWLAGMATRSDGTTAIFALDLENLVLGAELLISGLYSDACQPDPEWGEVEPDWIGVSPLGNYLVVQWVRDGTERCSGLETFNIRTGAFVGRVTDHHNHGDLGVDTDGTTEFFMTNESSSPEDNNRPAIAMRRLPGTETASTPVYLQVVDWSDEDHISCKGPEGVCLVSWGNDGDVYDWPFENELFLQYTDGSVLRLAHHRSSKCGYWVQPRASLSRDGRYAVFASDWSEGSTSSCNTWSDSDGIGDPYIIEIGDSEPMPDITANGSDGPLTMTTADPISVTVSLYPGSYEGRNADWWVWAKSTYGTNSYVYSKGWEAGTSLCVEFPLLEIESYEVWNSPLPAGEYTVYFAIDNNTDGLQDATWMDSVQISVTE